MCRRTLGPYHRIAQSVRAREARTWRPGRRAQQGTLARHTRSASALCDSLVIVLLDELPAQHLQRIRGVAFARPQCRDAIGSELNLCVRYVRAPRRRSDLRPAPSQCPAHCPSIAHRSPPHKLSRARRRPSGPPSFLGGEGLCFPAKAKIEKVQKSFVWESISHGSEF